MATAAVNKSVTIGNRAFANDSTVTYDAKVDVTVAIPAVPAANVGTLSTRTSDTVGTLTLGEAHTITTGAIIDIHWATGVRYGVTVGTVSTTSVPFSLGAGDNLPAEDFAIIATTRTELSPLNITGSTIEIIAVVYQNNVDSGALCHIDFQDAGSASIEELDLVDYRENGGLAGNVTDVQNGDTNGYTGNPITKAFVSHDSTSAATINILAGLDITP